MGSWRKGELAIGQSVVTEIKAVDVEKNVLVCVCVSETALSLSL